MYCVYGVRYVLKVIKYKSFNDVLFAMVQSGFSAVPKDRSYFKLRVNLEKQLCLTVQQVSENERDLEVERCFGVLVSPGRNVKHSDMQLLEMVSADHL